MQGNGRRRNSKEMQRMKSGCLSSKATAGGGTAKGKAANAGRLLFVVRQPAAAEQQGNAANEGRLLQGNGRQRNSKERQRMKGGCCKATAGSGTAKGKAANVGRLRSDRRGERGVERLPERLPDERNARFRNARHNNAQRRHTGGGKCCSRASIWCGCRAAASKRGGAGLPSSARGASGSPPPPARARARQPPRRRPLPPPAAQPRHPARAAPRLPPPPAAGPAWWASGRVPRSVTTTQWEAGHCPRKTARDYRDAWPCLIYLHAISLVVRPQLNRRAHRKRAGVPKGAAPKRCLALSHLQLYLRAISLVVRPAPGGEHIANELACPPGLSQPDKRLGLHGPRVP